METKTPRLDDRRVVAFRQRRKASKGELAAAVGGCITCGGCDGLLTNDGIFAFRDRHALRWELPAGTDERAVGRYYYRLLTGPLRDAEVWHLASETRLGYRIVEVQP